MKKFTALFLLLVFLLCGCNQPHFEQNQSEKNQKTEINNSSVINNNSSVNKPQTNANSSQPTTEIIVIPTTDKTTVPHNDISASQLTNQQAKEILEVLIPKQFEVFSLFQLDFEKIDKTQSMPGNNWYKLCTDRRFSCVQDIKDFISQVYTGKQGKWYFDVYLDCEPTTNDTNYGCYYLDYDGKLYRNTSALGKGLNFSNYLMDTTRITERTENTVSIEMDAQDREDYPSVVYKFLLCKTENGWRLDSPILDSYYLD